MRLKLSLSNIAPAVVQVFQKDHPPCWFANRQAAAARYSNANTRTAANRMYTTHLGVDAHKGEFFIFEQSHALQLVSIMLNSSYVCFGGCVWQQTRGIPMGIAPAVHIAHLHLLHFEYRFRMQLVQIIKDAPDWRASEHPGRLHVARQLLQSNVCNDVAEANAAAWPDAAYLLLKSFQYFGRFVDDVFCGPNPFMTQLMTTQQTLMAGRIHGLHPTYLRLEDNFEQAWRGYTLKFLDVEMQLRAVNRPGTAHGIIQGDLLLYDKLCDAKSSHLHLLRYHNVFSQISLRVTYGVICSRLCCCASHTTSPANFVQNAALVLHRFYVQGFDTAWLNAQLKRWIHNHGTECISDTRIAFLSQFVWKQVLSLIVATMGPSAEHTAV
jgi:hypothetical protein